MNEQGYQTRKRSACQASFPATPSCFAARLSCLLDQVRTQERYLFRLDRCDPTGAALAQIKLLWLRLQAGVPVPVAQLRGARLALEGFLEAGP